LINSIDGCGQLNGRRGGILRTDPRFRDDVVEEIPGVVHVDQRGRLQTVRKGWNEPFHAL